MENKATANLVRGREDTKFHGRAIIDRVSRFRVGARCRIIHGGAADETEAKGGGRGLLTDIASRSCTPQDENHISFYYTIYR